MSINSGKCCGGYGSERLDGGGGTEIHCLLIIKQSSLVPSSDRDCADAQRPDSAHPFPEGKLWKPKTVAIHPPNFSSYVAVSPSLCFYLALLLSCLQHGSGHASKGSAEQCEGQERNLTFFFFCLMVEVCHILGGQPGPGDQEKTSFCRFLVSLFLVL